MHDCSDFSRALDLGLAGDFHTTAAEATPAQLHAALAKAVLASVSPAWRKSQRLHENARRACYFSAEFLVGRAVYNNLLCLGMTGEAEQLLAARGVDLGVLEEIEDAALGNGGLGRLAACFLDSAATMNLPLDGYGIRYRYGLFRQTIENGFQREQVDDWTRQGDPWSLRCESEAVPVVFFDQTVTAVPYDMPIFGYGTQHVSTLRLWQAEPAVPFDFALFNEQKYAEALADADRAEDISRILYPNDTTPAGKRLRLKQQYFFCCASLQDILRAQKRAHGNDLTRLGDFVSIQLNDTHPVVSIPELLRLLIDVEGMTFDAAFAIARQVFCYTNHTIMSEALEKWDLELMRAVLPRIAELIAEIDARLGAELETRGVPAETARRMRIVQDGRIHMAYLAVYASRAVNGVAQLHTEILTGSLLRDWYALWPERFQNKTNGVTQRRWLALCNPELSALLTRRLGDNG
ncbi:MAG: glycogen/starch/alpha-glucan family phosphorylase, partial [Oscillospiraceae bacterium]